MINCVTITIATTQSTRKFKHSLMIQETKHILKFQFLSTILSRRSMIGWFKKRLSGMKIYYMKIKFCGRTGIERRKWKERNFPQEITHAFFIMNYGY